MSSVCITVFLRRTPSFCTLMRILQKRGFLEAARLFAVLQKLLILFVRGLPDPVSFVPRVA